MTEVGERARRAVLGHLLALSPWVGGGVHLRLRGSMLMTGWYLGRARPPADLDWLADVTDAEPDQPDALYGSLRDLARELPEERLVGWDDPYFPKPFVLSDEHLRPAGFRADRRRRAERGVEWNPPEWLAGDEPEPDDRQPCDELLALVRDFPVGSGPTGEIRLDADGAIASALEDCYSSPGLRLTIPWHAPGLPGGTARCDFTLPGPGDLLIRGDVTTTIPRGDGGWP